MKGGKTVHNLVHHKHKLHMHTTTLRQRIHRWLLLLRNVPECCAKVNIRGDGSSALWFIWPSCSHSLSISLAIPPPGLPHTHTHSGMSKLEVKGLRPWLEHLCIKKEEGITSANFSTVGQAFVSPTTILAFLTPLRF